jgi:hypothetical protein
MHVNLSLAVSTVLYPSNNDWRPGVISNYRTAIILRYSKYIGTPERPGDGTLNRPLCLLLTLGTVEALNRFKS